MSKYFGNSFGPSTRAPRSSFWIRCPSFLLSKFTSKLKLIQSVVQVRILGICVKSSILRALLSGFWISELQFQCPRELFPGSWVSPSQSPNVSGSRVSGLSVPESRGSGSWGPRSQSPRSLVSGPDIRLCPKLGVLKNFPEKDLSRGLF